MVSYPLIHRFESHSRPATITASSIVATDPWVAWNAQGLRNTRQQEPIKVLLPHGEMELHSVGNVLSREEYYKLTRAVGVVEARSVIARHGLAVGDGAGSGSNVRLAERASDADLTRFAPELAA